MADVDLKKTIGRRIREEREDRQLTLQELAHDVGIDGPRLSRIERGLRGIDTLVLRRIAVRLGLSMDAFFEVSPAGMTHSRRGTADDDAMEEMVAWAAALQRNGRFVSEETSKRA